VSVVRSALEGLIGIKNAIDSIPAIHESIMRLRNQRYFNKPDIHERMLADHVRVNAYHDAIQKHVTENDTVIDLGTGTGILAFFAARKGARRVHAIDHGDIIEVAQFLASENNITNVSFHKVHSTKFSPHDKVSVIIHEQMGSELFNEYMIQNICDLRDRLLVPGGRILPARFELFLEPISLRESYRTPFLWEMNIHGLDLSGLKAWMANSPLYKSLSRSSVQRRILPDEVDKMLCEPEPIFYFDLNTAAPNTFSCKWNQTRVVEASGRMDGFCLYFRTIFDDEISIRNAPGDTRTSWNCHLIRTEAMDLEAGDSLLVEWDIPDICNAGTWTVAVRRV
jgi:protein arginine N-methyltransferase 1